MKAMASAILALGWGVLVWAGESKTTLDIQGMTCGGCVSAVKLQLKRTEGVTAYEVSYEKAEAQVSYDPARITPEAIAVSVSTTGFRAYVRGGTTAALTRGAACQEDCAKTSRAAIATAEALGGGLADLSANVSPLVSAFNAAKGRPRFLAILSPTCSACVHGAEAVKAAVLPLGPSLDVFVVWTSMLNGDGAAAASVSSSILTAPHVRQYWDPGRRIGIAFRKDLFPDAVTRMKRSIPKDHFMAKNVGERDATQPEWDIYLLFEPEAEWKASPPATSRWVRQVALLDAGKAGELQSVMWRNDYASPPVEGTLAGELRSLVAGIRRQGATR